MRRWRAPSAILALSALGALPLVAQEPSETPPGLEEGESHVQGVVLDVSTGVPIPGALVVMRETASEGADSRVTADDGTFAFPGILHASYELELRNVGYRDLDLPIETEEGVRLDVEVKMVPQALELDPIVVTSTRRNRLELVGFHDRKRWSTGRFITRREIQERNPVQVSVLFRMIPGFDVVQGPGGAGGTVVGRGGCQPALYLDGIRIRPIHEGQLDALLRPDHLAGLEVYTAAQTPGQFESGRCGTIVAWTHVPEPGVGKPFQWRRFGVAAFLTAGFLLVF